MWLGEAVGDDEITVQLLDSIRVLALSIVPLQSAWNASVAHLVLVHSNKL